MVHTGKNSICEELTQQQQQHRRRCKQRNQDNEVSEEGSGELKEIVDTTASSSPSLLSRLVLAKFMLSVSLAGHKQDVALAIPILQEISHSILYPVLVDVSKKLPFLSLRPQEFFQVATDTLGIVRALTELSASSSSLSGTTNNGIVIRQLLRDAPKMIFDTCAKLLRAYIAGGSDGGGGRTSMSSAVSASYNNHQRSSSQSYDDGFDDSDNDGVDQMTMEVVDRLDESSIDSSDDENTHG
eukprot:11079892-Ditylum_brightwellii.AAC.1